MQDPIQLAPWPVFDQEMLDAAQRVLASGKVNYWTGSEGREFECEFAGHFGAKYAIALANGTIALEVALRALGIGEGDEVVVTPRTFVASASCAMLVGATPIFADLDPASGNLSLESIEAVLTPKTKAVIVVHLGGWPADMPGIMALAEKHDLKVIEDCAQAHGAKIGDRSVGTFGHISAWSFCQDKIITTAGEGGMVTTEDETLYERMWSLKDHGKTLEAVYRRQHAPGFRWLHEELGNNGRLTEVQSAIGRIALKRLPEWTSIRTRNAQILMEALADCPIEFPLVPSGFTHAYYKLHGYVDSHEVREEMLLKLAAAGLPSLSGSCSEVYRERVFTSRGLGPAAALPNAKDLGERSLMFLVHPTITEDQMKLVAERTRKVLTGSE